MASKELNQKKLKEFLARRHPEYDESLPHWEFLEQCYEGGREWFTENIFKYVKEGETEYKDRIKRAYRFNHTREVVDLLDKYIFKMEVARNDGDAPDSVKKFWGASTLNNLPIKDFVRQVSNRTSVFGRVWVVVDNTKTEDVKTVKDEKTADVRTYAYVVEPCHVLDMSYDERGELNWILIHEQVRDDVNPISSTGAMIDRFRLWERTQWTLFTVNTAPNGKVTISVDGPTPHSLGVVPVFAADNTINSETYCSPALIDDVAYLDRAVANYLSNLDAIIQDQTFSQLVMPAQGVLPGDEGYQKLLDMGTKRLFTFDGEATYAPFYLSPDVKQAELILRVINKIINEIYHTVGLAGERTKEDNSQGIDNSSGVAKAYDFERVNSLLAAKADSLELIENKLVELVAAWSGETVADSLVEYPNDFDVRGLYDEFEIAARLALIEAPDGIRQHQMEAVIDKLFPKLTKDIRDKMVSELKDWPPKLDLTMQGGQPGGVQAIQKDGANSLANKLVKEGQ